MRISILMHRYDQPVERYLVGALAQWWRSQGYEVEVLHGLGQPIRGDVVILHVDLTVVPDEYMRAVAGHPCVVNRRVRDISKTLYSAYQVHGPEEWDGPVIVKTVLNHGGYPERQVRRGTVVGKARNLMSRLFASGLGRTDHIAPVRYPIFGSTQDVPAGVWANPRLMVQRFIPEMSGELYCIRAYMFLGNRHTCRLLKMTNPTGGVESLVSREDIPVAEEIVALRERLGFDFGKLDYVMHEGQPVLLDANRTIGFAGSAERAAQLGAALAPGIASFAR